MGTVQIEWDMYEELVGGDEPPPISQPTSQPISNRPTFITQSMTQNQPIFGKREGKYLQIPDEKEFQPLLLAAQHPHPLDATIRRSKDHKYFVRWTTDHHPVDDAIGVSTLYKMYFPEFVSTNVLANMRKDERGLHTGKYAGMTSEQLDQKWKTENEVKRMTGEKLHGVIECFHNGFPWKRYDDFKMVGQWWRWWQTHMVARGMIPFRSEMMLRSDVGLKVTGTLDMLFVKRNHPHPKDCNGILELEMIDWKVTDKLTKEGFKGQTGYGCCSHLQACKAEQYFIQQYLYKFLLETYYRPFMYNGCEYSQVKVVSMHLVQFHDSFEEAKPMFVEDRSKEVQAILEERRQTLATKCMEVHE